MAIHARRRAIAAGAVVALVVAVAAIAMGSGSSEQGPPDDAAKLVPADALAYVGISTDTGRGAVRGALALARRFPAFASLRDGLLRRLTAPGCGVAASGMHGQELAVAVLGTGSLVLVDTGGGSGEGPVRTCGTVRAQRLGRFLVIGSVGALGQARAVSQGHAAALGSSEAFRASRQGLPADRFAVGYLSPTGLRGLLGARAGLGSMVAALLDSERLRAIGLAAEARAPGARLVVHELLAHGPGPRVHAPRLLARVPAGALGALDTADLDGALIRFGALLGGLGERDRSALAGALRGEVALWLTPAPPGPPTLTLVSGDGDEHALPRSVAGLRLHTADADGLLTVATRASGLATAGPGHPALRDGSLGHAVLGDAPGQASALGFLDFSELLRLGEQTGLDSSRAYRGIANDLRKVRAVGAVSTGDADQTTVQVELSIP